MSDQLGLFGASDPSDDAPDDPLADDPLADDPLADDPLADDPLADDPLPEGFKYTSHLITPDEERDLVGAIAALPFRAFEFQGYVGKRRVISFGWRYDFNNRALYRANDMPAFLLPLRTAAARFGGLEPDQLQHALVTEYAAGAGIGWHRDKGVFGEVIGVSLVSPCLFRLRRKVGARWERATVTAAPRSAYLLSGPARTEWEHSIPDVDALRYSVTFRNLLDA